MATSRQKISSTSSETHKSQYDQEIETRIKALEELSHKKCGGEESVNDDIVKKVNEIYSWYLNVKGRV